MAAMYSIAGSAYTLNSLFICIGLASFIFGHNWSLHEHSCWGYPVTDCFSVSTHINLIVTSHSFMPTETPYTVRGIVEHFTLECDPHFHLLRPFPHLSSYLSPFPSLSPSSPPYICCCNTMLYTLAFRSVHTRLVFLSSNRSPSRTSAVGRSARWERDEES